MLLLNPNRKVRCCKLYYLCGMGQYVISNWYSGFPICPFLWQQLMTGVTLLFNVPALAFFSIIILVMLKPIVQHQVQVEVFQLTVLYLSETSNQTLQFQLLVLKIIWLGFLLYFDKFSSKTTYQELPKQLKIKKRVFYIKRHAQ